MARLEIFGVTETDLVDDAVEDERGDVLVPSGRNVLEDIRTGLAVLGVVTSSVRQHSFYGWALDVQMDRVRIWVMAQFIDPWLLIVEPRRNWLAGCGDLGAAQRRTIDLLERAINRSQPSALDDRKNSNAPEQLGELGMTRRDPGGGSTDEPRLLV